MDFNSINVLGQIHGTEQVVYENTLSSVATVFTISGIDGDSSERFRLISRIINVADFSPVYMRFNGDSGNNYGKQSMIGNNTTASAGKTTGASYIALSNEGTGDGTLNAHWLYDIDINAKSGGARKILCNFVGKIKSTPLVTEFVNTGGVWTNTADNLTSITLGSFVSNSLGVGSYILLLKKVENSSTAEARNSVSCPLGKFTGDVFSTIYEQILSSDADNVLISGLDGDTDVIYEYDIMAIGNSASSNTLSFSFNSDTGNAYLQTFYGNNTSPVAVRNNTLFGAFTIYQDCVSFSRNLIYAKQGYMRSGMNVLGVQTTGSLVHICAFIGSLWNDTNTNLTSINVPSTQTSGIKTGSFFRLKTLKRKVT